MPATKHKKVTVVLTSLVLLPCFTKQPKIAGQNEFVYEFQTHVLSPT